MNFLPSKLPRFGYFVSAVENELGQGEEVTGLQPGQRHYRWEQSMVFL